DLENLLLTLYGAGSEEKTAPEIFLVGHSMGGTVVHEVACRKLVPNVSAVAVLDIMESYKIMGLNLIKDWCDQRPPTCATLEHAIQWAIESGTVRNPESARVSFPGMIARAPGSTVYTWHTDLLASQNDWVTWFEGLEQKFVNITSPPKLLILGGKGQIEGNMSKAHQDGKFRLMILPESGHAVEEDEPDKVAKELVDFWRME
ncbi:Protein with carboxyl methyl esterase activity, partial [Dissophora globulifera]